MTEDPLVMFALMPLLAYFVGSTPFGVLIARVKGIDLRAVGSGNVGATNVGRSIGRKWGYLCFVLDVAKGLLPVMAAGALLKDQAVPSLMHQAAWLAVAFGAIAGHVFSFYLKFQGGKGVATSMGVVLGIFPYFTWPGLCAAGVWILVTMISRYVSLGSIVAAVSFVPIFVAFQWGKLGELWPLLAFAVAMVALIVLRHGGNISRLFAGTENKIGQSKDSAGAKSCP